MIHINRNAKTIISKETVGIVLYVHRERISYFLVETFPTMRKKGVVYIAAPG